MLGYEVFYSLKINKLCLKNFRNYIDLEVEFNDKLNIIIGNNAQGKTNILEAIYFLSITKSFLSVNEKTLIFRDKEFSSVKGDIVNNGFKKKLSVLINNNENVHLYCSYQSTKDDYVQYYIYSFSFDKYKILVF